MTTTEEEPKVFWKSSVPDPDNIDLNELLNDRTEINLDDENKLNSQKITPTKSKEGSARKLPKPSPMKQSLEVNADMSKQEMM